MCVSDVEMGFAPWKAQQNLGEIFVVVFTVFVGLLFWTERH